MKVQPSIKRRSPKASKKGYFARRNGVLYYYDKTKPRHKQRQG